jgi:hypothetical protein
MDTRPEHNDSRGRSPNAELHSSVVRGSRPSGCPGPAGRRPHHPALAPGAGGSGDRKVDRGPAKLLCSMSLLTELDSFLTDHRHCGDLDAGVDGPVVWIARDCGASMTRRVDEAPPVPEGRQVR